MFRIALDMPEICCATRLFCSITSAEVLKGCTLRHFHDTMRFSHTLVVLLDVVPQLLLLPLHPGLQSLRLRPSLLVLSLKPGVLDFSSIVVVSTNGIFKLKSKVFFFFLLRADIMCLL